MKISQMKIEDIAFHLSLDPAEIREHYNNFFKTGNSMHPFLTEEQLNAYALRSIQKLYSPKLLDARKSIITSLRQKAIVVLSSS